MGHGGFRARGASPGFGWMFGGGRRVFHLTTGAAVMQILYAGSPRQIARARDILADARRDLYRALADDEDPTTPDAKE